MNKTINQRGGSITNNMSDADLIIIKSNSAFTNEETERLKKYRNKLITENWYNSCVEKN